MNTLKNFVVIIIFLSGCFNVLSQTDPKLTEVWDPVPAIITPGTGTSAPSDAIVLFDGKNLDQWEDKDGGPAGWIVENGIVTVKPGAGIIKTKQLFSDCQLHIEWRSPTVVVGESQGRGNSGIFLQSLYELQVLDSYNNVTYSNGQAGSIYKQSMPLVNCCRKPGEWQTYDVIFTAPRANSDGSLKSPAYITVLHNGVLIQNHYEIKGSTEYIGQPSYKNFALKESLLLQDHGNDVSYRNIWIRELGEAK
jgi:hypothetical protein